MLVSSRKKWTHWNGVPIFSSGQVNPQNWGFSVPSYMGLECSMKKMMNDCVVT